MSEHADSRRDETGKLYGRKFKVATIGASSEDEGPVPEPDASTALSEKPESNDRFVKPTEAETRAFRVQTVKLPTEEEEAEPGTDDAVAAGAATAKAGEAEARTAATVDVDNADADEHEEPAAERQTRGVEEVEAEQLVEDFRSL